MTRCWRRFGLLLAAGALVASAGHAAGDPAAGRAKAAACAVCHGANGVATAPDAPNLAGQPELYLSAQLRAYRSGARKHEVMSLMAAPLSDADIANLAAWFGGMTISVTVP